DAGCAGGPAASAVRLQHSLRRGGMPHEDLFGPRLHVYDDGSTPGSSRCFWRLDPPGPTDCLERADLGPLGGGGEFDPAEPVTLELIRSRVHPEDIRILSEKIARARRDGRDSTASTG